MMACQPIYVVLFESSIKTNCSWCLSGDSPVSCCSQCRFVSYCSKDCQKKDWNHHKIECLVIKNMLALDKNANVAKKDNWLRPLIRTLQLEFNENSKTKEQDKKLFYEQVLQMVSLLSFSTEATKSKGSDSAHKSQFLTVL